MNARRSNHHLAVSQSALTGSSTVVTEVRTLRAWHVARGAIVTALLSLSTLAGCGSANDKAPGGEKDGTAGASDSGAPSCTQGLENYYAKGCGIVDNGITVSLPDEISLCTNTMEVCPACRAVVEDLVSCFNGVSVASPAACGACSFSSIASCFASNGCDSKDAGPAADSAGPPPSNPDTGPTCSVPAGSSACLTCAMTSCCTPYSACASDSACSSLFACVGACAAGDTTCENTCSAEYPSGVSTLGSLLSCLSSSCPSSC